MVSRRNPKVTDLNNFAISSDGIATALQDSASSLMAAGNNLEQSVAMIAAANKVLQDPSSVGSALRTISLRIRGTSVKQLEELGEEVDGVVESTSKLQAKVKGLSGVDILTDTGAYKDTYTIIKEIAQVWDQMNDIDRAALLELLAGKNRSNAMAALLTNLEDLEGAYESAMDAQGSADAENEKYLNSIQGKIDKFTNALQSMWSTWLDSSVIKLIVDLGTALVKLADAIGLVGTAAVATGAKFALPKLFSGIKSSIVSAKDAYKTARGVVSTISAFNGEGLTSFLGGKIETASISEITHALGTEIMAQKELNKELAKNILLKNGVQEEDIEGALAAMGFTGANGGLALSFKSVGVAIKEAAIAFWASPFGKFAIIAAGIALVVHVLDQVIVTHGEYVEKLKETSDEISTVKNDIKSLSDELKTTQDRINELELKDKLSFTDKEELKKLKAQNAELERSIQLKEQKEKRLQKKAAKQLDDAVRTDSTFGNTQVYKNANGEYVSASEATDVNSDNYAVNGDPLKEGYSKETVSIIQSKIIEYQIVQKELDEAKDELENIGDDATDKQVKAAENKVEDLKKKVTDARNTISETMETIDGDYLSQDGVEWQYGNPDELEDWQKQMNANLKIIYDAQDKLAIGADETGKAIESAFTRVTNQTEFEDELKQIQDTAGITGESLRDMLSFNEDGTLDTSANDMSALVQALMDCGVIAGTSADELQRVVDLSMQLGDSSSDAAIANKKLALSQKRLKYYQLYKDLNVYAKKLKEANRAADALSNTEKNEIQNIRAQMAALASQISAYDILGEQIDEAKASFEKFEKAKETDENNDYGSKAEEMLSGIVEGLQSAKIGTEAFKAAVSGMIPEDVYSNFDTVEEKVKAIANYLKNSDFNKYFTLEFDDDGTLKSAEMTLDNVKSFIESAQDKGVFTNKGDWTHFELSKDIKTLDAFCEAMGVTKEMAFAMFTEIDSYDGEWLNGDFGTVLNQLDLGTDANIYTTTKALANLDQQLFDGTISLDEYTEKYNEALLKYGDSVNQARTDISKFLETQNLYNEQQEKTNELLKEYQKKKSAGEDTSEIEKQLKDATNQLGEYGKLLQSYEVSELTITVVKDQVDKDIEEVESKFTDFKNKVEFDEKSGKYQLKSGITFEEGSEDQQAMDSYLALLNEQHDLEIALGPDSVNSLTILQDISSTLQDISDVLTGVTAKQWIINAGVSISQGLTDFWNWITGHQGSVTVDVKPTGGGGRGDGSGPTKHFDGTANASGNWGLPQAEHNSLVGELGMETVVDPHTGHYYTVGDHGAELVDLPKDAIIFNHLQTKELFKNGHINSRGKAYADGNAHVTIVPDYTTPTYYSGASNNNFWTDWNGAAGSISDAADKFEEVFDWFEVLLEEIENNISLMNAKLENTIGISAKKGIYSEIINTEQFKLQELYEGIKLYSDYANKLLAKVPDKYKEMAKNGAVAITDFLGEANKEVVESINNYREWAKKVTDLNQQLEETKKTIADTHVEIQSMIKDEYDNRISLITSVNDRIQETIDLLDEEGKRSSAVMYEEMIKNSTKQLSELQNKRAEMQKALDEAVTRDRKSTRLNSSHRL